jgi:hypothetical protein
MLTFIAGRRWSGLWFTVVLVGCRQGRRRYFAIECPHGYGFVCHGCAAYAGA